MSIHGPDLEIDPEATPPHDPAPHAQPEPAYARPGIRVAPHDHGILPQMGNDLDAVLRAARELKRITGSIARACQDPEWRVIRPRLIYWESILAGCLRRRPDDDVVAVTLQEVRSLLGRRTA